MSRGETIGARLRPGVVMRPLRLRDVASISDTAFGFMCRGVPCVTVNGDRVRGILTISCLPPYVGAAELRAARKPRPKGDFGGHFDGHHAYTDSGSLTAGVVYDRVASLDTQLRLR